MDKTATTPMLKQYHQIKAQHQECILFFRLGDFYEMFFDDAKIVSRELDLVLTSRGKTGANKVPMCGFPHHAAENYIARLVKAGYKIAICDQMEDPALAKGIVKRDVTRIISSGTYLDENTTDTRYLLCLSPNAKAVGVSFIDPANGTIQSNQFPLNPKRLTELIARLPVFECIYPDSQDDAIKDLFRQSLLKLKGVTLSPYNDWCFNPDIAKKTLCEHFHIHNLHGFGIEQLPSAVSSAGALLEYLKHMNKQPLEHIDKISLYIDDDFVFISPAAYRGLELPTLLKTIDHTTTALGKRKFRFWLYHPLKNTEAILARQDAVQLLRDQPNLNQDLKHLLQKIPDMEKNISRLSCGYTHAKDLLALRQTLTLIPQMIALLKPLEEKNPLFHLDDIPDLRERLCSAVNEDIPLSKPEGKIIQTGYHKELDQLRDIQANGHHWLKKLQEQEIQQTGIPSLKIGFNKVFGYYIEITKTHLKSAPQHYIRKQTLVNAERFITPELKEYEDKILTAQDKIVKIENELVKELRLDILRKSVPLHALCDAIATIDAVSSLTVLSRNPGYICPTINHSSNLIIEDGRHPVVEQTILDSFTPNDVHLNCKDDHLVILTGPNMSGKSTYIRQVAILVIMAQMGSYLPAAAAQIGIVDKIFTRIGAHDDIAKGQSTFMVEMNETADILNNLTERSLVILDEIGRGTSTYDGLSLAWALAEHLQQTKARTLFATHFHELTALAQDFSGVKNYNVAVKEWEEEIIFLHKIVPGGTDDSYGIYVAKLAGIPDSIISQAKKILTKLELKQDIRDHADTRKNSQERQLDLFSQPSTPDPILDKVRTVFNAMDINQTTPLQALNKIDELRKILQSETQNQH
jgi:DNA mismatch repair protein MutS